MGRDGALSRDHGEGDGDFCRQHAEGKTGQAVAPMRMLGSGRLRWSPSQGLEQWKDRAFSRSAVVVLGRAGCCRNMYCAVVEAWQHSDVKLLEADLSVTVEPKGLLWEGQIGHRWDGQGGLGNLEESGLSTWAEGDANSGNEGEAGFRK